MKRILILGVAYFLINSCVYSAHNYMLKIISASNNLTPKQFAVLDMLLIVKFLGSFFWTNMADRTRMHRAIIAIGLMGYAIFLSMFYFAPDSMKADGLNFYTILYYSMFTFFLSAVYATLDAFCLEYLESKEKEKKLYGRIKLFGCAGHSFAPLCLAIFANDTNNKKDNITPIINSLIFAALGSLHIIFTFGILVKGKSVKVKNRDPLKKRIQKNMTNIKKMFSLSLALLLLSVTLQGIHRNVVSTYLEMYADECKISRKKLSCAFAVRFIPEATMLYLTCPIDNAIGTQWMIFIGILFGIFRPLLYSFMNPVSMPESVFSCLIFLSEISKGCFSGLFNYSCSKLVKDLSTRNTKSLTQGLFNGCYSGLAPCLAGIIVYLLIESPTLKIQGSNIRFLFFSTSVLGIIGVIPMVILIMRKRKEERRRLENIIGMNDIECSEVNSYKQLVGAEESAA